MGAMVQSTSLLDKEEKPLLSVHQQFSALTTMGHPLENHGCSFHWSGVSWFRERDKGLPYMGECNVPGDFKAVMRAEKHCSKLC